MNKMEVRSAPLAHKLTQMGTSPPAGIDPAHVRPMKGPRRNSCEARPGLIESSHIAPLDDEVMVDEETTTMMGSMDAPPPGIPEEHMRMTKGPRRNSCEARPGLIESTHLAPLNEGLMAGERKKEMSETTRMKK